MIKSNFLKRLVTSILVIPLFLLVVLKGGLLFNLFLSIIMFLSFIEWIKISSKNFLLLLCGIFFLIFSFYCAFLLRSNSIDGLILLLFLVSISVSTDIGGYFFGKLIRGPKLTKISPNKTFSGSVGSFITSLIIGILFYKNFDLYINLNIYLIIISLSLVSQIGDLVISYLKRKNKVKDTGKILPGHGGVLDRIDGLIFVIPFYYLLNIYA